jgi:hypothetical protein
MRHEVVEIRYASRAMKTFEVSIELDVPRERAFEALRDHPKWSAWMPASFRPLGASSGPLVPGAKCKIAIAGVPGEQQIRVTVVDAPRELRWVGGVRGVLFADHAFFFDETAPGRCRVRSSETWSGVLFAVLRARIAKRVPAALQEQLDGLKRAVT